VTTTDVINLPTGPTSEEKPSSVVLPAYANASSAPQPSRRAPLFVPRDQAYYWTVAWQRDEVESLREIAEGKARRFSSGATAAEWLLTDDE
jgi:hypothetical protein